jgi:hypothetical protein
MSRFMSRVCACILAAGLAGSLALAAQIPGAGLDPDNEESGAYIPGGNRDADDAGLPPGRNTLRENADVRPGTEPGYAAGDGYPQEQASDLVNNIIEVNTRFAYVSIAHAAVTTLLVLLLLFRLSGIRSAQQRFQRDMSNTKDALRYLMDMDRQGAPKQPVVPVAVPQAGQSESAGERSADIARITAELEKLARRFDDLPRPQPPAAAQPPATAQSSSGDAIAREVERRLAAMHLETIEPGSGDKFDPLLHDEVDSKPSRGELDGTIFRVIQSGLVYNNRVALKARVVVNRA